LSSSSESITKFLISIQRNSTKSKDVYEIGLHHFQIFLDQNSYTKGSNVETSNYHHAKRRWVVERTNSWHNRFRKLLVRYEKKLENYFALVCLGCCILIYRRIIFG